MPVLAENWTLHSMEKELREHHGGMTSMTRIVECLIPRYNVAFSSLQTASGSS